MKIKSTSQVSPIETNVNEWNTIIKRATQNGGESDELSFHLSTLNAKRKFE